MRAGRQETRGGERGGGRKEGGGEGGREGRMEKGMVGRDACPLKADRKSVDRDWFEPYRHGVAEPPWHGVAEPPWPRSFGSAKHQGW